MKKENLHVALVFKDFSAWVHSSCIGLNSAVLSIAKVLREHKIDVSILPVKNNIDLVNGINKYKEKNGYSFTDVIICAPFLSGYDLKNIVAHYPNINFLVLSHSNVGFLQADPFGIELLRRYLNITRQYTNLYVGGNSPQFTSWFSDAYSGDGDNDIVFLPNLYPLPEYPSMKPTWNGWSPIKIGAFGSARPEKNLVTAAAAAILIQRDIQVPIELHMTTGGEQGQNRILAAIQQMYAGLNDCALILHEWSEWDEFIKVLSEMDLLLQPSYTESFNMITADGISVGVPTVTSHAIYWSPKKWRAEVDSAESIADVGINLLTSKRIRNLGIEDLKRHNKKSLEMWLDYLTQWD